MKVDFKNITFLFEFKIQDLFEFCGYEEGRVAFSGLNTDTFRYFFLVLIDNVQLQFLNIVKRKYTCTKNNRK